MAKEFDFQEGLQKHLRKCELEYRAEKMPKGCYVDWLEPICGSTQEIAEFLRYLGFKIHEIIDDVDCGGDADQRVETTSGIIVWVNSGHSLGFMCRSCRAERGNANAE